MSSPPSLRNESIAPSGREAEQVIDPLDRLRRSILAPVRFLCFWIAIALPFVQVALLAHGLDDQSVTAAFLALLGVNVVTLYVGHDYGRS